MSVIAAIATPLAPAGLGVVRLSGDGCIALADRLFRPMGADKTLTELPGYSALYGHVFDADGDIDDCVALVFRAPHSYTGEDVVELSCHGGVYLLQRVLRAALDAGAEPAGPGEFTKRAFLNGKMDLTGADAVMDLIGAQGDLAARTALAAREGAVFRVLSDVKTSLLAVAAQMAAYVDYPDEDIPELQPDALQATLTGAKAALSRLLSTFDAGRVLREGVDTVIAGTPNVGKSTLMNRLAGFERSIVTQEAGTTRDVVEETVRLGNVTLRLSDTAGIRQTDSEAETLGVRRAWDRLQNASLILAVFDGSAALTEDDRAIAEQAAHGNAIAVLNKADCPPEDMSFLRERFSRVVVLSAKTGAGLEDLTREIEDATGIASLQSGESVLSTERQRACARRALDAVEQAESALRDGFTPDVIAVSVESAIGAIAELTGERASEAVVGEVFARFCVGK